MGSPLNEDMGRILREARIKKCEVLLRTCCMLLHAQTQQIWLQACKGFLCTSPYTSQQAKVRIQDIWLVGIILKGDSRMSSSSRCPVRTNDPINHPDCALQRRDRSEAFKALPTGIFIWMLRKQALLVQVSGNNLIKASVSMWPMLSEPLQN